MKAALRVDGYEGLFRAHHARILRLCQLLLADRAEAEDVSQEVFVKLLRAHREGAGAITWGPWLTRVAVNACRDRRRSRWWRSWRAAGVELDEMPANVRTPEEAALGREQRGRIWSAFLDLPPRQREVFVLRHLEGWSTEEVATALGLHAGSVKRHLFRAVRRVRRAVEQPT